MPDPRTIAAKLTAQLHTTFADDLRSVVVFGSLPRGEAVPGVSDLNILVLLESTAPAALVRAAPVLQQWIRQGNTAPYVYSWEEWGGMHDTFAIEITDMSDAREVLWGEDPVNGDAVTYAGLRSQTEREIRDMLLHLRLRLMVAATDAADIGALLMSALPSLTAYLRAALRLDGQAPGLATRPVVERAAALVGADPEPVLAALHARRTTHRLEVGLGDAFTERYMAFARALLRHLDGLPANAPARAAAPPGGDRSLYAAPDIGVRADS